MESNDNDQPDHSDRPDWRRKQASLYDAVAGRVGYEGFLTEEVPSKRHGETSRSATAVPPEEVLFRRKGAPIRYEEDDIYPADRHLGPHQRLPDSDLLKTIHAYASDFYAKTGSQIDFKSLDETALLAMGILLEEAAAEPLGKSGDLALMEGQMDDHDIAGPSPGSRDFSHVTRNRSVIDRSQSTANFFRSQAARRPRSASARSTRSRSNG